MNGQNLSLLLLNEGRVLPADFIMGHVHGYDDQASVSAVRMHVMHLRRKIADLTNGTHLIRTVPGTGYCIIDCRRACELRLADQRRQVGRTE
jgi:DNA-binding response OmpR family regulator